MAGRGGAGRRPRAVFMAFGTQGDVFPIAALAAAFACDQQEYAVVFITHSAHRSLSAHLAASSVRYMPVSSPPVLAAEQLENISSDSIQSNHERESFSMRKKAIQAEHRKECLSFVEEVFGNDPSISGDFIVINFFALEGWHLAELFQVKCVIAAPYFVPYSAPTSFKRQFKQTFPLLYKYFQEAPANTVQNHALGNHYINVVKQLQVCWTDIIHWMWALFMESWGSWRNDCLNLSPIPFTDPVTNLPLWHVREESPLLLYGFSKEIVECPGYWPFNAHACGFWFLPMDWQFSCDKCMELSGNINSSFGGMLCANHSSLEHFLTRNAYSSRPIFVGLSSIGRMGFLRNPKAFLMVLKAAIESTDYMFILFSSGYKPLDSAIQSIASSVNESRGVDSPSLGGDSALLFNGRLFCFLGSIPYSWLFPRCAAAIHHAGSGSTAAALLAGIPQVTCPFMMDQFYWSERLQWLGVAPEPLQRQNLVPDNDDALSIHNAADVLVGAIRSALSPETKAQAARIADRLSSEDGIGEALRILKARVLTQNKIISSFIASK
ncbi:UDP-Glycosyltransferase superfamily protein [Zea mays]|uniref:UDP-Glycosyltransferase superfamily protein n=2 Tax=Zea mays TaxID=4577 RepID=A0A1D6H749_MAIZE|nr:UDP-Glycosyltransferase superfamily protein [Zea mays]